MADSKDILVEIGNTVSRYINKFSAYLFKPTPSNTSKKEEQEKELQQQIETNLKTENLKESTLIKQSMMQKLCTLLHITTKHNNELQARIIKHGNAEHFKKQAVIQQGFRYLARRRFSKLRKAFAKQENFLKSLVKKITSQVNKPKTNQPKPGSKKQ